MYRKSFSILVILLMLTACGSPAAPASAKISVENAWARPAAVGAMSGMSSTPDMQSMPGMSSSDTTSAAYFQIVNTGSQADALIGASSSVASKVEMHETRIVGDVAEMVPIPRVDVPAHGQVEFKPGGYHVMLEGLTQDLKEGQTITLTLQFENSGAITLDVPIRPEN
jgi:periplasmic copper chaperone A